MCEGHSICVCESSMTLLFSLREWQDGHAKQRRTAREPRAAQSNTDTHRHAHRLRLTWLAVSLPLYLSLCLSEIHVGFFTSTGFFVQQLVAGGALALKAYWSVHADMRAAAVVDHALIQPWETKRRACGQIKPITDDLRALSSFRSFNRSKLIYKRPKCVNFRKGA